MSQTYLARTLLRVSSVRTESDSSKLHYSSSSPSGRVNGLQLLKTEFSSSLTKKKNLLLKKKKKETAENKLSAFS